MRDRETERQRDRETKTQRDRVTDRDIKRNETEMKTREIYKKQSKL